MTGSTWEGFAQGHRGRFLLSSSCAAFIPGRCLAAPKWIWASIKKLSEFSKRGIQALREAKGLGVHEWTRNSSMANISCRE